MVQKFSSFYKSVCWRLHGAGGGQVPGAGVVGITVPVVAHALSLLSLPSFNNPFANVQGYFYGTSFQRVIWVVVPVKFKGKVGLTVAVVSNASPVLSLLSFIQALVCQVLVPVGVRREPS